MSKKAILISPADSNIYNFFERQFNVISSDNLNDYVSYEKHHADMQVLNINGKLFVNSTCKTLISTLNSLKIEQTVCNSIGSKYPQNVALNAALVGRKLLCNKHALHKTVKDYCDKSDIEIIHVNQGYAKCSTLILNGTSIITDDEGIAKASLKNNINVLKIEKGDIKLDANTVGFIGGASTKIGDTVYFFGDINSHRNAEEIKCFIKDTGLKIECVSTPRLIDIGGVVLLN